MHVRVLNSGWQSTCDDVGLDGPKRLYYCEYNRLRHPTNSSHGDLPSQNADGNSGQNCNNKKGHQTDDVGRCRCPTGTASLSSEQQE